MVMSMHAVRAGWKAVGVGVGVCVCVGGGGRQRAGGRGGSFMLCHLYQARGATHSLQQARMGLKSVAIS